MWILTRRNSSGVMPRSLSAWGTLSTSSWSSSCLLPSLAAGSHTNEHPPKSAAAQLTDSQPKKPNREGGKRGGGWTLTSATTSRSWRPSWAGRRRLRRASPAESAALTGKSSEFAGGEGGRGGDPPASGMD